jgi:hypothetical protein
MGRASIAEEDWNYSKLMQGGGAKIVAGEGECWPLHGRLTALRDAMRTGLHVKEGIMARVLATCLCLAALLAGCDDGMRRRASYADWTEAERDDAFRRGWLPSWMSRSVRDIEETHNSLVLGSK